MRSICPGGQRREGGWEGRREAWGYQEVVGKKKGEGGVGGGRDEQGMMDKGGRWGGGEGCMDEGLRSDG